MVELKESCFLINKLISTMNNNNYNKVFANNISEFYKNLNVFITGCTGFVGKVLVEKLLRSCHDLGSIYLLMRPKKGVSCEQRFADLFKSPIFNKLKETNAKIFSKVKIVSGDISAPNMGISENEMNNIIQNVNVVLHSAATVRFNENLKNAVLMNTLGTKRIIDLCKDMKQLKSFVYVSTAYSNPDKKIVYETVYDLEFDYQTVVNFVESFSDENIELLSKKIIGKHPNTYTLTKALAEQVILQSFPTIPCCIVRPSIITSAWKEPYPGWVDSLSGINGIFMECARGTISSVICDEKCKMDLIPVDVVVNTIITAAWQTASRRSDSMKIYNCTSGNIHPITCKEFRIISHKHFPLYPSKYLALYPRFTFRTNECMHFICSILYHTIPAIIFDLYLYMSGKKPMMLKTSSKFSEALDRIKYFTTREWDFKTENMEELVKLTKKAVDGNVFDIDIRKTNGFDWNIYIKDFIVGTRLYILKDDLKSLPKAVSKLNRIYWFQKLLQLISLYYIIKFVYKFI